MVTTVGTASDVIDMLNDLIQLNYDAIHAYDAAIARIDNVEHQRRLTAFKENHERHTAELDSVIRKLGSKPAHGASIKHVISAGKVTIADLFGDCAVLRAMKTKTDDTNKVYERAAARRDLPQPAVRVIQNALGDERKHRDWLEKAIAAS